MHANDSRCCHAVTFKMSSSNGITNKYAAFALASVQTFEGRTDDGCSFFASRPFDQPRPNGITVGLLANGSDTASLRYGTSGGATGYGVDDDDVHREGDDDYLLREWGVEQNCGSDGAGNDGCRRNSADIRADVRSVPRASRYKWGAAYARYT